MALPTPMLTTIFCSLGRACGLVRPSCSASRGRISEVYRCCNLAMFDCRKVSSVGHAALLPPCQTHLRMKLQRGVSSGTSVSEWIEDLTLRITRPSAADLASRGAAAFAVPFLGAVV